MRFRTKENHPIVGQERTVTKFAWFPITALVTLNPDIIGAVEKETRWLEKVTLTQTFCSEKTATGLWYYTWRNRRFVD